MARQKVVFTIINLGIGGSEMSLYNILRTLDREQFDPVVVSMKGKEEIGPIIEKLGIPVHCLGVDSVASYLARIPTLARVFYRENPDVIQAWLYHANFASLLAKWMSMSRARIFWSIRNTLSARDTLSRRPFLTKVLVGFSAVFSPLVDGIIFNSKRALSDHEEAGLRSDGSIVIPNGIDTALWKPDAGARAALRERLHLPTETPLVGLIARYTPAKDHAMFITATAILLRTRPALHVVMAGPGVTPDNTALADLIAKTGAGERFHLLGQHVGATAITQGLDVACCSSLTESFPNTVLEAMACGVPCVSTNVGDVNVILQQAGIVVPPGDAGAFAEAIEKVLTLPPAGRQVMSDAGVRIAAERYSLSTVINRYHTLYRS